jgi:hypothetical protein
VQSDPLPVRRPAAGLTAASRQIALLGVLSLSFLQYYFLTVLGEIYALPTLVVFAPFRALSGA